MTEHHDTHPLTILEWIPSQEGMEQEIEVHLTSPTAEALLNEFNRQYGGGVLTLEQDGSVQIDSTTHEIAWLYRPTA